MIEIIMVIVILGILSAVMVPKFRNFTLDAHKANVQNFAGTVKTALEMNATRKILDNGEKKYPKAGDLTDFSTLFERAPKDWSVVPVNANNVDFVYYGDGSFSNGISIRYTCSGNNDYSLVLKTAAYDWDVDYKF